jgi:hypothetical protein
MFCPKCGKPDQSPETYCRKCGTFLPDFDKASKKETPAEEHIKINSTFSIMTAVVSLSLAITLYVMFIGREGTQWIIFLVFGFLMGGAGPASGRRQFRSRCSRERHGENDQKSHPKITAIQAISGPSDQRRRRVAICSSRRVRLR